MPTATPGKQPVHVLLEEDLVEKLDDFRFTNRFETRAAALRWLLRWALERDPKPGDYKNQDFRRRG